MKHIFLIVFSISTLVVCCNRHEDAKKIDSSILKVNSLNVPDNSVPDSLLHFNRKKSVWTLDGILYSGYAIRYTKDNILEEKIGFLNGKKQNQAIQWYPDGHFRQVANYHQGKLHGAKRKWSSDYNHILVSQLNYYLGKAHGEQRLWYSTGELYKKLNLNMGKEEGLQQAFRKNGDLYANYEAKEGRIFGLKKASLCFGLDNEKIQYEN